MLQAMLTAIGYDTPITGYFGDKTEKAVKNFQNENELKPDGKAGDSTITTLKSLQDEN
ncbi:peptidoglycan-binding protein (plasmid) [Adhaeribacter swui]|uniref:Peptidoglycan-binding protein n=2 Tax=Adhaeribacter swui TaxID=2086471 RepID=A0A7G7G2M5_9BACT|nr:peptidoglycan-binding protein [Adhaeribacter swui]